MANDRQAIKIEKDSKISLWLNPYQSNHSEKRKFELTENLGQGSSSFVYGAQYTEGGVTYHCVLKELFPSECNLYRNTNMEPYFQSFSNETDTVAKERYQTIKERYIQAYTLQNDFRNGQIPFEPILQKISKLTGIAASELEKEPQDIQRSLVQSYVDCWYDDYKTIKTVLSQKIPEILSGKSVKLPTEIKLSQEDEMMLSVGISPTLGLYENDNGVLYTVYLANSGISYENVPLNEEPLCDKITAIIQVADAISVFHNAGYYVFDIKEENIMLVGGKNNRSAMLFDFESLVTQKELEEYTIDKKIPIRFTPNSTVSIPFELKRLLRLPKFSLDIEDTVHDIAAYGHQIDIHLLASVLFYRIFGCKAEKNAISRTGDCTLPDSNEFAVTVPVRETLKNIFSKTFSPYPSCRYENMQDFISDLKALRELAKVEDPFFYDVLLKNGEVITDTKLNEFVLYEYSRKQHHELDSENGKFFQLKKLSHFFDCQVSLEDENNHSVSPSDAIESSNRVLLLGDGGMGKSTAVYDYWTKNLDNPSKTCFYIDLSYFSSIHSARLHTDMENGRGVQETPWNFLTYLETHILQKYCIMPKTIRTGETTRDISLSEQMTELENLFSSSEETSPKYVLFLDGYNEILDSSDKEYFNHDLIKAINKWKNVTFVVTSRAIKETFDEGETNPFESFSKFHFVGISDEEIVQAITDKKDMSDEQISGLKNDKIWEVLKIPMFLNMYLSLNLEDTAPIHTRGEILDAFIMGKEALTARRISDNALAMQYKYQVIRNFTVRYSLPFFANWLDRENLFYSKLLPCINRLRQSRDLYYKNEEVQEYFSKVTKLYDIAKDNPEEKEILLNIITTETGYCLKSSEGTISFSHQYFRDYFAAKHIQNILSAAQALGKDADYSDEEQLQFTKDNGLNYLWSDEVCKLLGEMIGDYKNEPGYSEK